MPSIGYRSLFEELFFAPTEIEVQDVVGQHPEIFRNEHWYPLGGDEKFFGVVRGQQSNPIAAIVEKVTNSIDALLMKKCYEWGIDPKSANAPRTMEEALKKFFPNYKQWDLQFARRKQAEEIQIVADGPPRNTSVIIYDNGEGQHPEEFENTFLSLVRGNKIDIHFVQGKYNMGGSGALLFCGKERYQLIGSKRFDNSGRFGFTLMRQRKIGNLQDAKRHSHFEYLKIGGDIPSFESAEMDLKLFERKFKTGTIIKLYSYQFPSGYAGFAQDLHQSLNEFLFEPVLPILTVDKKERYPNNNVLELDSFGLKRRLEEINNDYVDSSFSEEYEDELFGKAKITCYVFKPKLRERDVKKSKEVIRQRFFRNDMSVMFSMNGQVHGHFTSEFITRTLKFNLLKDYLLIHVDCTGMKPDFREELFMSDRERLKKGDEASQLRKFLGEKLRKSHLDEINRRRKESIGLESEDASELIKSFAKNLPKNRELFRLLEHTLKLEQYKDKEKTPEKNRHKKHKEEKPFQPKRFPSMFRFQKNRDGTNVVSVPLNGEKTLLFATDVENDYFDRTEEPGNLQLGLLHIKRSEYGGGNKPGDEKEISKLLNVVKSSPQNGLIKVAMNPTKEVRVGDDLEVKISLDGRGEIFEEIVRVKITEAKKPKEPTPKEEESHDHVGLPELKSVRKKDWDNLEGGGISMDHNTVMYPVGEGDTLKTIYINLDSSVFLNHRSKLKNEEQIGIAQKKYLASVYFHTLFLSVITKRKNYRLTIDKNGRPEEVSVDEYIRDVFDSYYSDFLLNFGMEQLIDVLEE